MIIEYVSVIPKIKAGSSIEGVAYVKDYSQLKWSIPEFGTIGRFSRMKFKINRKGSYTVKLNACDFNETWSSAPPITVEVI